METLKSQLQKIGARNEPCPERSKGWKHFWMKTKEGGYYCKFCSQERPILLWTSAGEKIRQRLLEMYGDLCWLCDLPFTEEDRATIEHVIPRAEGGPNTIDNYRLSHYSCNWNRGAEHHLNGSHDHKNRKMKKAAKEIMRSNP